MINNEEYSQDKIKRLLRRMTEIYENIDDQWITDQMQSNKVLLDKITDVIGKVDPEGLIRCGAPEDEYRPEAETILLRKSEWKSVDDLERVISEEFAWWFFLYDENDKVKHLGAPHYTVAARQIWNARLEINGERPVVFADDIKLQPKNPVTIIEID